VSGKRLKGGEQIEIMVSKDPGSDFSFKGMRVIAYVDALRVQMRHEGRAAQASRREPI